MDNASSQILDKTNVSSEKNYSIIKDLKALVKIGIVNSNLITTLTGFLLALHFTNSSLMANLELLFFTLMGTGLVIAGACILNNWFDVDIDPVMSRTQKRPTVTGSLSLKAVLWLGIGTSAIGHSILLLTSVEAMLIALFGWFTYVVLYTMWSKRRYTLNTIIGSFSGAVPPLVGWAAIDTSFHIVPIVLFLIMFIWQTPHFLALAMKKSKDYKAANIPMLPAVYGFEFTKKQIVIYIACLLPLPFLLNSLGTIFLVIATLLNIGWLVLGIVGFFMKNDLKWANMIFIYSINYMTILFLTMAIVTFKSPFV